MMNTSLLNTALFACLAIHQSRAFSTCNERRPILLRPITKYQHTITLQAKHYGPPSEEVNLDDIDDIKSQFTSLLHNVMSSKEEDIPSLLTTNIDTILKAMSERDLLEEIMEDEASTTSSTYHLEEVSDAVNTIITFVESFVEEASQMEKVYKKLLGRIFKLITPSKNNQIESEDNPELSIDLAESELDNVLAEEKEAFTPGFLRHLEGECERIGNAKDVSPESTRMLQILRLIQTRVLEELGKVRQMLVFCDVLWVILTMMSS